ncbi:MAG: hypothetical protein E4H36_11180 [Spirochaetales bacterium]|nr:MAG: hypothetical protein E4H36_11180 [Spirochaetales bacterium]
MIPFLRYRQDSESQDAPEALIEDEEAVRCAFCGNTVTSKKENLSIRGTAEHVFTNPFGYVYRIGCYRRAPGCGTIGSYTSEHSWFPGYLWCYALCAACKAHLGWHYISEEGGFFGLILENLV